VKEYIKNFSPTENDIRHSMCSFLDPLSIGEGLDMKGSDVDIMLVYKDVNVYEDINSTRLNSAETCVAMEMDSTELGFSRLRLIHCNNNFILGMCKQVGNDLYLSSQL
jgi:hypothetical protein